MHAPRERRSCGTPHPPRRRRIEIHATAGPLGADRPADCYVLVGDDDASVLTDLMAAVPSGWMLLSVDVVPDPGESQNR